MIQSDLFIPQTLEVTNNHPKKVRFHQNCQDENITFNFYINTSPHHEAQTQRCSKGLWSSAQQYKPHSLSPPALQWHPPKFAYKKPSIEMSPEHQYLDGFIPANPSATVLKFWIFALQLVGAQPSPCCSFARRLVEKRGHPLLICSSVSTAQTKKYQGLLVPR